MTDREKRAINLFKSYQYKLVYEISDKDKKAVKVLLNLIQKQDTKIKKLNRALDEMANTLDLNFSLSIENYKFGKKEAIKEYFMKEDN